jgi:glutamine amidotransferase-like uncharacterized protein
VLSFVTPTVKQLRRVLIIVAAASLPLILTGCGTPSATLGPQPKLKPVSLTSKIVPPVLLFNGTGTSSSDVSAVEAILNTNGLSYSTANSAQLNAMTQDQMQAYQLLIVPGGNSITIGAYLSSATTSNIHDAVTQGGLHYLGICAGGFFGGYSVHNGLNLTSGVWFDFFVDYNKGIRKESVEISSPGTQPLDQYWQLGPQFYGWGNVVGKYPNGAPAIVEGTSGNGWVILVGVHPEAPASWRTGMTFTTSVAVDNAYAGTLVKAALNGTSLKHY